MATKRILIAVVACSAGAAVAQSTRPAATTRPADMKFMTADQVFEQMNKPTTRPARQLAPLPENIVHDRTSGPGAVKPDAPRVPVVREGTLIIDRLGRLTHTDKGQAEFTFESDGKALRDPPMLLLPNLTLAQI